MKDLEGIFRTADELQNAANEFITRQEFTRSKDDELFHVNPVRD